MASRPFEPTISSATGKTGLPPGRPNHRWPSSSSTHMRPASVTAVSSASDHLVLQRL